MKRHLLGASAVAALLLFAITATRASAQQVATSDLAAVKAGAYKVEPNHTQVGFAISHFGFTNFSGFFSGASGTLVLDPANPASSKLNVSLPIQSVLTTVPQLDGELKGEKWFDATRFPTATFTSTRITKTGKETWSIVGELTLHGVTKPVTLRAHLVGSGTNPLDKAVTVGFEATGAIKRGDFGITQYLPLVGDDVSLRIAGAFELQQ